jgi:hypothetical protein
MVVIYLGAIPPSDLRGNSRANRYQISKTRKTKRDESHAMAIEDCTTHGGRKHECCWSRELQRKVTDKVLITFSFYHWKKVDLDNLAIGMKSFVDGIADSGFVPNDTPDYVQYGEHTFTMCKKGESKTVVTIERIK